MNDRANSLLDLFASIARRAPVVGVAVDVNGQTQVSAMGDEDARVIDALFEIGSITKTFTALLLADMAERQEVRLSDPLSKFLAIDNPVLARVKLLDLATHTARFPSLPRDLLWQAFWNRGDPYSGYDTVRLQRSLASVKQRKGSGTKFRYSNFGFATLGYALSTAVAIPFEELILDRVCKPLGMSATSPAPQGDLERRLMQGYKRSGQPVVPWDLASFAPAGILKSSPRDMLTYSRAHLDPSGLPLESALRDVQTPRVHVRKGRVSIGLGWIITSNRETALIWHNGGTGGFSSFAGFSPSAGVSLVALANARVAGALTRIGSRALERLSRGSCRSEL